MMEVSVGFCSDVGRQRSRNEDSYAIFVPYPGEENPSRLQGLLVVADGMGGERAGEQASRLASERIRQWFASGDYLGWTESRQVGAGGELAAALRRAVVSIGEEVYRIGVEDATLRGLGSTLVVAAFADDRVTVAHVGDSRCYRVRGDRIERLTEDHSWVQRQVEAGLLSPEEARHHPQSNILTRSLGDREAPEPDVVADRVEEGDLFVLCSDGLTGGLDDAEILAAARNAAGPQELAELLVRQANERDGSDNITVVAASCRREQEITRADIPAPELTERRRGSAARIAGVLVAVAVGFGAGVALPRRPAAEPAQPGIETRAESMLQKAQRHLERQELLAARDELRRALELFRHAPQAVEAQRRLSHLERQLASGERSPIETDDEAPPAGDTATSEPASGAAGDEGDAQEPQSTERTNGGG